MSTRGLLAALAGAVVLFFSGWLVYGILLMDFFVAQTIHYEGLLNEMPILGLLFLSHLVMAYLLVFIFEKWAKISSFDSGFVAGLILGFLIYLSIGLYFLAAMNLFSFVSIIVDVVVGALLIGLMGGVIAFILGTKKASE
jgi:hypothetical protein